MLTEVSGWRFCRLLDLMVRGFWLVIGRVADQYLGAPIRADGLTCAGSDKKFGKSGSVEGCSA